MTEDAELLRRYAQERTESAFAEFVQRHVDFVYGCAVRRVGGDAHFAHDVTQQVFVTAGREAAVLARHPVVTGWLYTATRNIAAQLVRSERRRHARELQAQVMEELTRNEDANVDWARLRPVLDEAMDGLSEADRQAVLLRYFEGKSFAEVGGRLRLAENAARMRVNRALDKLAAALERRGVTSSAAALAVALASQPTVAAPAGLAAAATGAALATGVGGGGAIAVFMGMTKLQLGLASAVVVAGTTGFVVQSQTLSSLRAESARLEQQVQAGAEVEKENALLRDTQREADALARARAEELAALQQKIADARAKLQAASDARMAAITRTTAGSAVVLTGQLYDLAALSVKPNATFRSPPSYPVELRKLGITGEAMMDFVVDASGAVQNLRAIKATHPEFAEAAVAAVQNWRFEPGRKDGAAVATHMQMPVRFTLSDGKSKSAEKRTPVLPWF
ncbi:TonB family protein [Opitutus sp. ER46]|uniref:TonB family protein n=1 Tax=Opitutus sp. ER46 TaxID=2161864 RepID=UPI000D2F76D2|nr:TonB family protein [Opitutus sp. ER46]PTX91788.1 hypothetical protein DB354_18195 [Opitutus sp. ER46]